LLGDQYNEGINQLDDSFTNGKLHELLEVLRDPLLEEPRNISLRPVFNKKPCLINFSNSVVKELSDQELS
jgi:hypothetical protein